tara:strand:- start:241 stop:384 length:144 start_codon:yes stop_codon:yes gene_type:complete
MKKIKTVKKEHAPTMNRKARRQLAKKIRKDLGKAVPLDTADDGRKSV